MSKKGGYTIIDLKDTPITVGTPATVEGIFEKLEKAPKKAVLLSGLSIGGEEKRDVFADMEKSGDNYVGTFGDKKINVSEDGITITNAKKWYSHQITLKVTYTYQHGRTSNQSYNIISTRKEPISSSDFFYYFEDLMSNNFIILGRDTKDILIAPSAGYDLEGTSASASHKFSYNFKRDAFTSFGSIYPGATPSYYGYNADTVSVESGQVNPRSSLFTNVTISDYLDTVTEL